MTAWKLSSKIKYPISNSKPNFKKSTILAIIFWQFCAFPRKFDYPNVKDPYYIKFVHELWLQNPRTRWRHRQVPSLPCRNQFLTLVLKMYTKGYTQFCLISLLSAKYFAQDFRYYDNYWHHHTTKFMPNICPSLLV